MPIGEVLRAEIGLGISAPGIRWVLKRELKGSEVSHYGSGFFLMMLFIKTNGEYANPKGERTSFFSLMWVRGP